MAECLISFLSVSLLVHATVCDCQSVHHLSVSAQVPVRVCQFNSLRVHLSEFLSECHLHVIFFLQSKLRMFFLSAAKQILNDNYLYIFLNVTCFFYLPQMKDEMLQKNA